MGLLRQRPHRVELREDVRDLHHLTDYRAVFVAVVTA
jgi:hypothetical protein